MSPACKPTHHSSPAPTGAAGPTGSDVSSPEDLSRFLAEAGRSRSLAGKRAGRLMFAVDATMSRQPTWDLAQSIQSEMFAAVEGLGTLEVQLVYFRGFGECRASRWLREPGTLARLMAGIDCRGGQTQIGKVLGQAIKESSKARVDALVFVGDAMEENADRLIARAGELALLGTPAFLFQEGNDAHVETVFREISRVTRGGWCRFDRASAGELAGLLRAVAVYAAGGAEALRLEGEASGDRGRTARLLLGQLGGGRS